MVALTILGFNRLYRGITLSCGAARRAEVDGMAGVELGSMVLAFTQYGAPEKR
jgi:hypothetical protein